MKFKSFFFIGDLIDLDKKRSIEIIPDYHLMPAEKDEIKYIKKYLDPFIEVLNFDLNRYEYLPVSSGDNKTEYSPLESQNWNYLVVKHNNICTPSEVIASLCLSELDLTVLFEVSFNGPRLSTGEIVPGVSGKQLITVNFLLDSLHTPKKPKLITSQLQQELLNIYASIQRLENFKEAEFIKKGLDDFVRLSEMPNKSPFKVLGYISILELLLTTSKARSNGNSINIQLQKKINLLNNQWEKRIEIDEFFKGANTNSIETVINKLYQYRNDIAHGNSSDFDHSLQILKNKNNILAFLRVLTKKILQHAIIHPQFIVDFKEV